MSNQDDYDFYYLPPTDAEIKESLIEECVRLRKKNTVLRENLTKFVARVKREVSFGYITYDDLHGLLDKLLAEYEKMEGEEI